MIAVVVCLVVLVVAVGLVQRGADAGFNRVERLERRDPTAPADERDR